MKSVCFLLLMVLGLSACRSEILHADALKISNQAVCQYYIDVGKDCKNIYPDSSERFNLSGKSGISFYYLVQKEPLLEIVVYVKDDGSHELNKMEER